MSSPPIGITAWRRTLDTYLGPELLQTLSNYYSDAVISAGMTPVIFPNGQDPEVADELVAMVGGLVISGGDDVDPRTYRATIKTATGNDRNVDEFEIALVKAARQQNKPVLAICRGLQLLNVSLGGTLNQDVTKAGTVHDVIDDDTDPVEMNQRRHIVSLRPDSILQSLYGSDKVKVNTLHHQGVLDLAPDLIVEGQTEDGLIEAARCDSGWWAVGVQWHPERMDLSHQSPLFGAFRQAVENS